MVYSFDLLRVSRRALSERERRLRIAAEAIPSSSPVELPALTIGDAPEVLRHVSMRRPRHADELQTVAGREAAARLIGWEGDLARSVAAARAAKASVAASTELTAEGKAKRTREMSSALFRSIEPTAKFVLGEARQAARIQSKIAGMARVRMRELSNFETANLIDLRQQLLAMSEGERNKRLLLAAQQGDVAVLESALSQPESIGSALGTLVGVTDRPALEAAYLRALAPEATRELEEVQQVAQAAGDTLQFAVALIEREVGSGAPEPITTPLAILTEAGFATNNTTALDAATVAAQAAGKTTEQHLRERAIAAGYMDAEPSLA